ncbi:MAG TPA: endolytic transglycosylase MltG [Candidatus Faecivivens stercoravium]|uniref:Endolytic murein transglycosylase n=1 Tax=Candidatus Faecivivens stercoravium TaxID=2840803 RepID=A0A9D1DY95_9FIRM|nr:endolytic transglycosylase MltG [Candidatus Faecivivens stercoravium]
MDNRQNRFPGPDEGFPEDMDEMEDLNPALPDADEILDGLGEDFRFDPDDTLSEEQEAPYGEPDEPLPVPADEERTIAFDAGHAEGTGEPAGLTQTVAIGSETPPPPPPPPEDFPPDEGDAMAMPKRSPGFFRRVPKRVYHRGWGISLAYTAVTVLLCVFIAVMFLRVFNDVLAFITENRAVTITIDADDSVDDVAGKLKDAGLIKYDWLFSYVAKFEGSTGPYQEGEHTLNDNMNYMQLLSEIEVQPVARETVWVTFTEGMTVDQMADLLEENGVCDADDFREEVMSGADYGYDFEQEMSTSSDIYYPLEGYLFPDTYEFYTNETPANVITRMLQNFQNKIDTVQDQMAEMGLTQHQTITLASIIQSEASGDPANMALVSSIYWNRLNDPENFPMLQSDPTRNYANSTILMTGQSSTYQQKAAAYDTYQCTGLPAGPICNPGMDAILAALSPETTAYYYFISDSDGNFYFAETLEQHEANIANYLD